MKRESASIILSFLFRQANHTVAWKAGCGTSFFFQQYPKKNVDYGNGTESKLRSEALAEWNKEKNECSTPERPSQEVAGRDGAAREQHI